MGKIISWLISESEGTTLVDNVSLFSLKFMYLSLRVLLRLALGKRKRDEFYVKNNLDFGVFWYEFFRHKATAGGPNKNSLLKFRVPKYGYQFYCRINKDDFKLMTVHEDEVISKFTPKAGDTVIDVGAHIGLYTIIGSKRVGPTGKVIALEPYPDSYYLLKRNLELNQLDNVIALECAASSSAESLARLYLPSGDQGFTKLHTIMPSRAVTENFVEVSAKKLDDILYSLRIEHVEWIKIDVEGAELEVMKGASETLTKNMAIKVLVEIHNVQGTDLYLEILQYLTPFGFHSEFEKRYANGERHVLFVKDNPQQ